MESAICIPESRYLPYIIRTPPLTNIGRCSGPIGIYFLLKRCVVLYLYGDSGSYAPPPYVDSHGEIDMGLRWVYLHSETTFLTHVIVAADVSIFTRSAWRRFEGLGS